MVTFTEKILNGKLHFFCSDNTLLQDAVYKKIKSYLKILLHRFKSFSENLNIMHWVLVPPSLSKIKIPVLK